MMNFEDYQHRFDNIRLRREDGILEITIHRDGRPAALGIGPNGLHAQLGKAFGYIARDSETRVVILTGAGDVFLTELDFGDAPDLGSTAFHDRIYSEGMALLNNLLAIPCPVIGAVNGDAFIHAELPVLSDIVLAAEHARFADKAHFTQGVVPGDGVHVVWPMLLGPNRGRYFLLSGEEIDAHEARRLGFVAEVLTADDLLDRAWELARMIAAKPREVARHTRMLFTQPLKQRLLAELSHGLIAETFASFPR